MPPPDQPQRPKPNMPEAARQALLAREAAAKAKAAETNKPAVAKAPPPPPPPVEPARPRMDVGMVGFGVWMLAASVASIAVYFDYRSAKSLSNLFTSRTIGEAILAAMLFLAIWLTQSLEKDARLVKLAWAIAILTLIAVPVVFVLAKAR